MDSNLLLSLTQNILSVNATEVTDMDNSLAQFEDKYCFDSDLQPMYTADALHYLLSSAVANTFYEIVDYFNISILFFLYNDKRYIVGPYVKSGLSDSQIESILIEHNAPVSKSLTLKLYYTELPILYTAQLQKTVEGIIHTLDAGSVEFEYRRLTGFINDFDSETSDTYEEKNYSEIYKRYENEKRFLLMIKNGDVENIMTAYNDITNRNQNITTSNTFKNYYTSASSFAILRTLVRKAAEESGLSVITIDSITQKYVQLFSNLSLDSHNKYVADMVLELTQAVRNHRLSYGKYSNTIQRVIEFIDLHLSAEITLEMISEYIGISISHLSMMFKKETGETISTFIAKQRCKKAASLLKETNLPIQEISSFIGYNDNNYFVKVFKKYYGVTPSNYRNS